MASVYKGLTIQINGDTSKLTAALATANKAASETQTQLTKIGKALAFDPSNLTNAATKLNLVQNKAEALAASLQITRSGMEALSSATSSVDPSKTIGQLAASTENAALNANLARQRYNEVNEQLAKIYTSTNSAARKTEELGTRWKDINNEPFKLEDYMRMTEDEAAALRTKMEEVGVSTKEWGTTAESTFTSLIGYLQKQKILTEEQANKIISMREAWATVANELDDATDVQKLKNMDVQVKQTEADVQKLVQEFAKVKISTDTAKNIQDIESRVKSLDTDIDRLKSTADQMDEALRLDPSNIEAAATKTKALREASELAKEKAELLGNEVKQLGANSKVRELADNTKDLSSNFEKAQGKVEKTAEALAKAKAKAAEYESALKRLSTEQGVDKTSEDFKQAEKNAEQAAAAVKIIESNLKQVTTEADNAAAAIKLVDTSNAQTAASAMSTSFSNAASVMKSTDWSSIGNSLTSTVTAAIQNVASQALDMANDFDSAYRDMVKTVQGTEEEFAALKDAAIDFSTTHVTSASQILEIQAIGGELGLAAEDVQDFSEAISNISVATNIEDVETAANDLGSLANIMDDLSTDTFTAFSDALVRLGNNGASTESNIMDISQRIGSMASIVGMSTPEVLAFASTVASTGQNAEAAGTAISNTMSDIESAVANGGDKLQAFADVARMSADDFRNTWESKPIDAIKAFVEGLNSIEESGGSADATLEGLGITGVRQKQAIEGLMQTIDGLNDNLQMSRDAWNGVSDEWGQAGDAAREAEKKAGGLSGSLSKISNAAENVSSMFGDALTPLIAGLSDVIADVSESFSQFSDAQIQGIAVTAGLVAAAGPLLTIVGALGAAFGTAAGPIVAVVAGFSLLAGAATTVISGINETIEHEKLVADATQDAADIIETASTKVEGLGDAFADIEPDIDGVLTSLADVNEGLKDNLEAYSTNSAYLDIYMDKISELAGKQDLNAFQQEELKQAVDGVNDILGTNVSITDAANGALDTSIDKLYASAEAWAYNAKQQAYQNAVAGYIQASTDALVAQQIAQEKVNQKVQEAEKLQSEISALENSPDKTKHLTEIYTKKQALSEVNGELEQYRQDLDDASKSLETATWNETIAAQAANASSAVLDTLSQKFSTLPEQFQTTGQNIAYALANGLESGEIETQAQATAFADATVASMANMPTQFQAIGYTAATNLATQIANGSISVGAATDIMKAYATGDLSSIEAAYGEAGIGIPESLANAIALNSSLPADASQMMMDAVYVALTNGNVGEAAQLAGHDIDAGLVEGINAYQSDPEEAARTLGDDVMTAVKAALGVNSPSTITYDAGMNVDQGLANGMTDHSDTVKSAGESVAGAAIDGVKSKNSEASGWGADLGGNFASGISSMWDTVAGAASSLASAVAGFLHFSAPDEGPWSGAEKGGIRSGRHLAENFAEGIESGISDVEKASDRLAQAAEIDAKAGEINYEIKTSQQAADFQSKALIRALNKMSDANTELGKNLTSIQSGTTINGVYYQEGTEIDTAVKAMTRGLRMAAR